MTLKRNILSNYLSQIYLTAVSILMVPLYIKYMGAEAYGLVGFFAMLQVWFNLLDMGMTPTTARETARYQGGAIRALNLRQLTRALEGVFVVMALIGGLFLFISADWIALKWLNAKQLPISEISDSLRLIAIIVALRWLCGFYRGIIMGAERFVHLSVFNAGIATTRFVLILPVLIYYSATPLTFFSFQLAVVLIELTGLATLSYRILPKLPQGTKIYWEWAPLQPLLKFSLSIAFTSSVWVVVTQTDKLVLSKILSLTDYGFFTLAVLAASGVSIVGGPMSAALLPRLARLQAQGDDAGLIRLYRQATQAMAVIALPVAAVLGFGAERLLLAWTGNAALAEQAAPILSLYALGNGVLAMSALPYYLQFSKGNVRLHLIGSALFVLLLTPSIIAAAMWYGGEGAGWVWLGVNLAYLLLWVPLVHRRLVPGLHAQWLGVDVLPMGVVSVMTAGLFVTYFPWGVGRLDLFAGLMAVSSAVLVVTALASSTVRSWLISTRAPALRT
jgi:O-antigen/teichoic acid export membrane protein